MSAHVFHEIYLHFNWHTQRDDPLLTPEIERKAHAFIRKRSAKTNGVFLLGIGGTPTHLHLVAKVEPSICPSAFVADIKGACSRAMNAEAKRQVVRWQRGFGVVSFAKKHLDGMLGYVEQQKAHHAQGTVKRLLEQSDFGPRNA